MSKKLWSKLVLICMLFTLVPVKVNAAEIVVFDTAEEIESYLWSFDSNAELDAEIHVNKDMDFAMLDISLWEGQRVKFVNTSNEDITFYNVAISGAGEFYFGEGINFEANNEIGTTGNFNNALFVQGFSNGYAGQPKVTINGDIINTLNRGYSSDALYVRFGASVIVNGDIIAENGNDGISTYSADLTVNGDVIVGEKSGIGGNGLYVTSMGGTANTDKISKVTINGDVKAGNGYFGGTGVKVQSDVKGHVVTINGNITGGDSEHETGIESNPEFWGPAVQSYGYALYASDGNEIRYSGKVTGGKLGSGKNQKSKYDGGDYQIDQGSGCDEGPILPGKYTYIGTTPEEPEVKPEEPNVKPEEPGTEQEDIIIEVDGNKDITITGNKDIIPAGSKLEVAPITNGEQYTNVQKKIASSIKDSVRFAVYNIDLLDNNNVNITQLNGYARITMPVPTGFSTKNILTVYRYEEDGTLTKLNTIVKDGKVTFETNHFSIYTIVETAKNSAPTTGDITANNSNNISVIMIAVVISGLFVYVGFRKRNA